jgi:hypothetical protein
LKRQLKAVVFGDYSVYPMQGSDMAHPACGIDRTNPQICYISAPYKPVSMARKLMTMVQNVFVRDTARANIKTGVAINIWNGIKMRFSSSAMKMVDINGDMGGVDRFGPQWAPRVGGGSYLTWVNNGWVRIALIKKNGAVKVIQDICHGSSPSICTDDSGDVHLIYTFAGTKYRKLTPK